MQFKEALKRIDIIILTRKWMQLETQTQKKTPIFQQACSQDIEGGVASVPARAYMCICVHMHVCVCLGREGERVREGGGRKEGRKEGRRSDLTGGS